MPAQTKPTDAEYRPSDTVRLCHDLAQHVAACLLLVGATREVAGLPSEALRSLDALREEFEAIATTVSGQVALAGRRVELVDLVALVAACARTAERAHLLAIPVVSSSAPRVAGVVSELRRAVENVVDNACRATPSGTVEVRILEHDGLAEVEVTDDGPGFGRIPRGTGLGLEQVLAAVHAHGGELAVDRSPSGGTTIRLSLPTAGMLAP